MDHRRTAMVTGTLFVITFVAAVAAVLMYGSVLSDPNYVVGPGADGRVKLGAFLEVILILANVGTAVTLYPIVKRQHESVAIGYVAARVLESAIIAVGIFSLLSIVTLRQEFGGTAGAGAASFVTAARSMVAFHDWTFLLGPGFLAGVGNGILLGYLMYRSRLVPRGMAMLGLIGGPLVAVSGVAVLFGLYEQVSGWSFIATLPEMLWEGSLGIYLIVRGFSSSAIRSLELAGVERTGTPPVLAAVG